MSKQRQKFKFDLKTILTLIVLAAALVLGVFNGWQDAEDKGAAAVPAYAQELADYSSKLIAASLEEDKA